MEHATERRIPSRRLAAAALLVACLCRATAAGAAPKVGDVAPAFVGKTSDAEPVSVANYGGRVVVLSFWASWCGPCLKELPILESIQRSAGRQNLQVIAVNTEAPDVYRKISRHLATLDLMLTSDAGKEAGTAYGVHGIPHMVIIGRDGRIVRVHHGYQEKELDHILDDINAALAAR